MVATVQRWPGSYSDARGREAIVIRADAGLLVMEIRGAQFTGRDFDGLDPSAALDPDALFTIAHGALTDYRREWEMPVRVVVDGQERDAVLRCRLILASPSHAGDRGREELSASLARDNAITNTTKQYGFFEDALADLQRQLPAGILIKACISCALSDYHPAGSGLSGSLTCFRDSKDAYLVVTGQHDLFRIWDARNGYVLETSLCPRYERRGPQAGYRGGFPDVRKSVPIWAGGSTRSMRAGPGGFCCSSGSPRPSAAHSRTRLRAARDATVVSPADAAGRRADCRPWSGVDWRGEVTGLRLH